MPIKKKKSNIEQAKRPAFGSSTERFQETFRTKTGLTGTKRNQGAEPTTTNDKVSEQSTKPLGKNKSNVERTKRPAFGSSAPRFQDTFTTKTGLTGIKLKGGQKSGDGPDANFRPGPDPAVAGPSQSDATPGRDADDSRLSDQGSELTAPEESQGQANAKPLPTDPILLIKALNDLELDWNWRVNEAQDNQQAKENWIREAQLALESEQIAIKAHTEFARVSGQGLNQDKLHLVGQDYKVGLGEEGKKLRDNNRQGFVLVGTSCLGNLELIKQIQGSKDGIPHLIVADYSANVSTAWDAIRPAIVKSTNLKDLAENIQNGFDGLQSEDKEYVETFLPATLFNRDNTSFDTDEELHNFFREVALRAMMVPCNYAVADSLKYAKQGRTWAETQEGTYKDNVILYTSNIYSFLRDKPKRANMLASINEFNPRAIVATNLTSIGDNLYGPSTARATKKGDNWTDTTLDSALDPSILPAQASAQEAEGTPSARGEIGASGTDEQKSPVRRPLSVSSSSSERPESAIA